MSCHFNFIVMQVNCEHPNIIVNPSLREYILKYLNVTIKGHETKFRRDFLSLWTLPLQVIKPFKRRVVSSLVDDKIVVHNEQIQQIFKEDLDSCFVTDYSTGQIFPVYIEVPCGKCDLCKSARVNSFVERCKMETQCYDSLPWFVTLTYNDEYLPLEGVQVRDVQLFLKRFRINLVRSGYDFKLRYAAVGEYGHHTKRPHYHLIIWGLDTFLSDDFNKVHDILESSWSQGFIQSRVMDASDDKGFYYTAKYLMKDGDVPLYEVDGQKYPCNPFFFFSPESVVD